MNLDSNVVSFAGSMKAGAYTAQLGVSLVVAPDSLTVKSSGRSYRIERAYLRGFVDTSIFGLFKKGIQIVHQQPGLPSSIVFYPAMSRELLRQQLFELGWK